jgi:membrane-associated phospholipid phosphatase
VSELSRSIRTWPRLPRGRRDFVLQVALWLAFAFGYEAVRWLAAGDRDAALRNGRRVIRLERDTLSLFEVHLQRRLLDAPSWVLHPVDWTYWIAQYVVLIGVGVWLYFRAYRPYLFFRNTLILANVLGLVGYLTFPLAPPRMFPQDGFVDTLLRHENLNMSSGMIHTFANPFAAMPSLHAADALVVAMSLARASRSRSARVLFFLWPLWVAYALMASANHYWLDILVGFALALGAAAATTLYERRRRANVVA